MLTEEQLYEYLGKGHEGALYTKRQIMLNTRYFSPERDFQGFDAEKTTLKDFVDKYFKKVER